MKKVSLFWLLGAATVLGVIVPTVDYHFGSGGFSNFSAVCAIIAALCILYLVVMAVAGWRRDLKNKRNAGTPN